MLSFIKRHSVSLAKGQSRTGFYPATRRNNSNLCCTSTASAILQIKILSKQRKSGKTCTCANFRERGPRNCHFLWWLKILSIFSLLFSSESTIHRKPWSDAQNCAIPPLLEHHFLWAAHPLPRHSGQEFVLAKDTSIKQLSVLWQFTEQGGEWVQSKLNKPNSSLHT